MSGVVLSCFLCNPDFFNGRSGSFYASADRFYELIVAKCLAPFIGSRHKLGRIS